MTNVCVDLFCEECPTCHVLFWISTKHQKRLASTKENFCCPNGHKQSYSGKTDKQKLREAEEEKARLNEYNLNASETATAYFEKWKKCEKELKKFKPKEKKIIDKKDKKKNDLSKNKIKKEKI